MYYDDEASRSRRGATTRRLGTAASRRRPRAAPNADASAHDVIEEGPPGAVLDLDDPQIRIEAELPPR